MNLTAKGKTKNFTTNGRRKSLWQKFHDIKNTINKEQADKLDLIKMYKICTSKDRYETRQEKTSAKAYI